MININTLDTVIAVVIVLLVLSLVVQSVQQGLKKLFKIKSRQIEDSLVDLFENVLDKRPHEPSSWLDRVVHQSPLWRAVLGRKHPAEYDSQVHALFTEVIGKFKGIGRVAQSGKPILDSIAKEDLLKVLEAVAPHTLTPNFTERLQAAYDEFQVLATTVDQFNISGASQFLSEEAKNKLAEMQGVLRPLLNAISSYDISSYLEVGAKQQGDEQAGTTQADGGAPGDTNNVGSDTGALRSIINDIIELRKNRLDGVFKLLGEAQKHIERELARARLDPHGTNAVAALTLVANRLETIAREITSFGQKIDAVLANFTKVETWYDTVMQSFEERYTRSMKTWGLVISFLVVVVLNANFFSVYQNIATSDVVRSNILQTSDAVVKRLEDRAAKGDEAARQTVQEWYRETKNQISNDAQLYTGFGFSPLRPGQVWSWLTRSGEWDQKNATNWQWFKQIFYVLSGWTLMTLLLSVGAPFWQDTLESLFGLKNLLRKKSDTKNVETEPGTGQPRT